MAPAAAVATAPRGEGSAGGEAVNAAKKSTRATSTPVEIDSRSVRGNTGRQWRDLNPEQQALVSDKNRLSDTR